MTDRLTAAAGIVNGIILGLALWVLIGLWVLL